MSTTRQVVLDTLEQLSGDVSASDIQTLRDNFRASSLSTKETVCSALSHHLPRISDPHEAVWFMREHCQTLEKILS